MTVAAALLTEIEVSTNAAVSDWKKKEAAEFLLERVLYQAEKDEHDLAYYTSCKSENARKQSGSYYTPVDVAKFFWNQFFFAKGIADAQSATGLLCTHRFIEPSCGSGVLVYTLLRKFLELGVSLEAMRDLDLHLVDVNDCALDYSRRQFSLINSTLGDVYFSPSFENKDFLIYDGMKSDRPIVFFGNPPFVSNPKGATWKNTYADFMDRCLQEATPLAAIHFIVPLSIAFSRDYSALRHKLRLQNFAVYASHFDNIPDTLFKSGKPQSRNSNRANSQRCTIISVLSAKEHRLYSSELHRWNTADRATLLNRQTHFEEVTNYRLGDQFIRPSSPEMARYLQCQKFTHFLGDLVQAKGRHNLYIGSVARNYISVRGEAADGVQTFTFNNRHDFYRFLGIIVSDVFIDYWRSVGDGFHVTRANIMNFPVSESLDALVEYSLPMIRRIWSRRQGFEKSKLNSGAIVRSYDFSGVAPSFNQALSHLLTVDQTDNEEI